MSYSFFAVLNVLPQIAAAAFLPILGIAVVSYLIRSTRHQPQNSVGID